MAEAKKTQQQLGADTSPEETPDKNIRSVRCASRSVEKLHASRARISTLVHKHASPTQRAPRPAAGEPIGCMRAVQTLKQACFQGYPESAVYVQIPVGSRNSASRSAYHTSLRPSSLFEPRHPSLKVVSKHNHRVAGATSRQYEHNTTGASRQRLVTGGNCHKGK